MECTTLVWLLPINIIFMMSIQVLDAPVACSFFLPGSIPTNKYTTTHSTAAQHLDHFQLWVITYSVRWTFPYISFDAHIYKFSDIWLAKLLCQRTGICSALVDKWRFKKLFYQLTFPSLIYKSSSFSTLFQHLELPHCIQYGSTWQYLTVIFKLH